MKALQRVVWKLVFLVFGVHLVNAEEQENQAQIMSEKNPYPIPPSRPSIEEDALL